MVLVAGTNRYRTLRKTMYSFLGYPVFKGYEVRKTLKAVNPSWVNYSYCVKLDYED